VLVPFINILYFAVLCMQMNTYNINYFTLCKIMVLYCDLFFVQHLNPLISWDWGDAKASDLWSEHSFYVSFIYLDENFICLFSVSAFLDGPTALLTELIQMDTTGDCPSKPCITIACYNILNSGPNILQRHIVLDKNTGSETGPVHLFLFFHVCLSYGRTLDHNYFFR